MLDIIKVGKSDQFLREKTNNRCQPNLIQVLELSDNDFQIATITMLCNQTVKINVMEMNLKIDILSRKARYFY